MNFTLHPETDLVIKKIKKDIKKSKYDLLSLFFIHNKKKYSQDSINPGEDKILLAQLFFLDFIKVFKNSEKEYFTNNNITKTSFVRKIHQASHKERTELGWSFILHQDFFKTTEHFIFFDTDSLLITYNIEISHQKQNTNLPYYESTFSDNFSKLFTPNNKKYELNSYSLKELVSDIITHIYLKKYRSFYSLHDEIIKFKPKKMSNFFFTLNYDLPVKEDEVIICSRYERLLWAISKDLISGKSLNFGIHICDNFLRITSYIGNNPPGSKQLIEILNVPHFDIFIKDEQIITIDSNQNEKRFKLEQGENVVKEIKNIVCEHMNINNSNKDDFINYMNTHFIKPIMQSLQEKLTSTTFNLVNIIPPNNPSFYELKSQTFKLTINYNENSILVIPIKLRDIVEYNIKAKSNISQITNLIAINIEKFSIIKNVNNNHSNNYLKKRI